ncbi:MAG: helix-turn-helix transcriptional regulator [Anaerolineae bacterium]|nr:helix-turn-helix transcriptional regulator [Anaerolineae bacterium]
MLATKQNLQKLTPVLVYIQTHLDQELLLAQLAELGHLSPFHFQRLFLTTIGETPKAYVQRLRLERAAYQLKIREDTILEVALNNGYHHHETFSRAFKRWFGVSPQQYRLSYGRALHGPLLPRKRSTNWWPRPMPISRTGYCGAPFLVFLFVFFAIAVHFYPQVGA